VCLEVEGWPLMDKRKALILSLAAVLAAIVAGVTLTKFSAVQAAADVQVTPSMMQCWRSPGWLAEAMGLRVRGAPHGMLRWRCYELVEVSEEFKENVVNIAQGDADVQGLLSQGYNITAVRPIIKAVIKGDGTLLTKATGAVLTLRKDAAGCASVWVDLEQGRVTRIEVSTRTVIEKP